MLVRIFKELNDHIEEYLMGVLLIALTLVMLLQVFLRFIFNTALSWPEEFCRYCFVYFAFLTIGYCVKNDSMLKLDFIRNLLPKKAGDVLCLIIQLFCLAFFIYMLVFSYSLVTIVKNTSRTSPAMGIQFYYIYISTIIGFTLAVVRSLQFIIRFLRDKLYKGSREETIL